MSIQPMEKEQNERKLMQTEQKLMFLMLQVFLMSVSSVIFVTGWKFDIWQRYAKLSYLHAHNKHKLAYFYSLFLVVVQKIAP